MSDIFHVISDATRREILYALLTGTEGAGELRVSDLVEQLELSQPTVSKHLKVLREVELVQVREEGAARYYSLNVEPLSAVEDFVLQFLNRGVETEVSVEYLTESGESLGDLEAQTGEDAAAVLPEQVSQAAVGVGRAAAAAARPVKELVARFKLRG